MAHFASHGGLERARLLAAAHGLPHVVTAGPDPHPAPLSQLAEAVGHLRRDSPSPCVSALGGRQHRQLRGDSLCPASVATDPRSAVSALGRRQPSAFAASPFAITGTNRDPQELFHPFGIEHNSSFRCPRSESAESSLHTSSKAVHIVRGRPFPCETQSPFREIRTPLPRADALSRARGCGASRRTASPTRAAPACA